MKRECGAGADLNNIMRPQHIRYLEAAASTNRKLCGVIMTLVAPLANHFDTDDAPHELDEVQGRVFATTVTARHFMKSRRPRRIDAEAIRLFDAIAQETGFKIGDAASLEASAARWKDSITSAGSSPMLLHGHRVEKMFGYVAASLRGCKLVKEEDVVPTLYVADDSVSAPDYRLVLNSGQQLLVEVKNCNGGGSNPLLKLDVAYVDGLRGYCALFGLAPMFATYWSRWRFWTLVPATRFQNSGSKCHLTMLDALKFNEMYRLGDFMIGTRPPLKMRIVADTSKARAARRNAGQLTQLAFTVKDVEFYCDGVRIESSKEKSLAFYLMLNGGWHEEEPHVEMDDGAPLYFEFTSSPQGFDPVQGFAMFGFASTMIASVYTHLTVNENTIERLTPRSSPAALGILIAPDYKSAHLPLWRFHIQPADDK